MIKSEIKDLELKEHLKSIQPDKMVIFTMANGLIRGAVFNASTFVNQVRSQHNLGILETMILGQASICAALTIPMMKGMEHLSIKYSGSGSACGYSVEANSSGYVRGFLYKNPIPISKPLENWDLSEFLGTGTLSVSRMNKEFKQPFTSTVEANSGNIAKDFAVFYNQSEQTKTAFNSSVQFDKSGKVVGAGGMFLQVMPNFGGKISKIKKENNLQFTDEELIIKAENAFSACPSLGQWFSENGSAQNLINGLFVELKPSVALERDIVFDCPCSEEQFIHHIKGLPESEIKSIKSEETVECVCNNCGSIYKIQTSKL